MLLLLQGLTHQGLLSLKHLVIKATLRYCHMISHSRKCLQKRVLVRLNSLTTDTLCGVCAFFCQQLEQRCLKTEQCIAFNSRGEFKSHLQPKQRWKTTSKDEGLYVAGVCVCVCVHNAVETSVSFCYRY